MDALKLFALTASWFGRDEAWRLWKAAQEASNTEWGAKWELEHISHMQTSLAILYREKWGQ